MLQELLNSAQAKPLENIKLTEKKEYTILFSLGADTLEVSSWNKNIIRMRLGSDNNINDYGILVQNAHKPVKLTLKQQKDTYEIQNGNVTLVLESNPVRFTLKNKLGKELIRPTTDAFFTRKHKFPPFAKHPNSWTFSFDLPMGEKVYGLGEQHQGLNQRGRLIHHYNEDSLGVNSDLTYKNIPFAWSLKGWGIFVHTPSIMSSAVGYPQLSHRSYICNVDSKVLDIFLFSGNTPKTIIQNYLDLTGYTKPVPLWSLGSWISRAYYKMPTDLYEAAENMRKHKLPCDVVTLDGRAWQYTEKRFAFEWDHRFPDPKKFLASVKKMNYHISAWMYPLCSVNNDSYKKMADDGFFLTNKEGKTYEYEFDQSAFGEVLTPLPRSGIYDFTKEKVVKWWKEKVKELCELGIDTIKTDFAEQVPLDSYNSITDTGVTYHNVYSLQYNKITYEAGSEVFGKNNFLVWGRSAFSGSQRYPVQWCGDSQSDFGGLAASIVSSLNYGMSGVPYYADDIGGFYGEQPDDELYIRWTQASTMASHMRFHGIGLREPYYFSKHTLEIAKKWLNLRYNLIPYIQATCEQAVNVGLPVKRSMIFAFPKETTAHDYEFQYMLGDAILVVPVLEHGGNVKYYLPKGIWYDFWTGKKISGGKIIEETVPIDKIPIFIKNNTVLPLAPVVQHTGEFKEKGFIEKFHVYGSPKKVNNSYLHIDNQKIIIKNKAIKKENIKLINCKYKIK